MTPEDFIRERRAKECFPIVNRGYAWYTMLTHEQQAELKSWYKKWLDAPETLYTPDEPKWLRQKLIEEEEIV